MGESDQIRPLLPITASQKDLESVAEALLSENTYINAPEIETSDSTPAIGVRDPKSYLILPGQSKYGKFSYPEMLVTKRRLADSAEVQKAAQSLGSTITNTALQKDGYAYDYIGNVNWSRALSLNLTLGGRTLHPRQHADLRKMLQDGIDNNLKVYDGSRATVPKGELQEIYNDILKTGNYRGEWLDADFKFIDGKLWIYSGHQLKGGKLEPQIKEPLESGNVMEDCLVDLKFNRQGFPTAKSSLNDYQQGKNIHSYFPRSDNNSVAWFGAGSGWAGLYCDVGPSSGDGVLGVRAAKILGGNK